MKLRLKSSILPAKWKDRCETRAPIAGGTVRAYFVDYNDVPRTDGAQDGQRHGLEVADKDAVLSDLVARVRARPRQPLPFAVSQADDVEPYPPAVQVTNHCHVSFMLGSFKG